jgi:hypothetical protein
VHLRRHRLSRSPSLWWVPPRGRGVHPRRAAHHEVDVPVVSSLQGPSAGRRSRRARADRGRAGRAARLSARPEAVRRHARRHPPTWERLLPGLRRGRRRSRQRRPGALPRPALSRVRHPDPGTPDVPGEPDARHRHHRLRGLAPAPGRQPGVREPARPLLQRAAQRLARAPPIPAQHGRRGHPDGVAGRGRPALGAHLLPPPRAAPGLWRGARGRGLDLAGSGDADRAGGADPQPELRGAPQAQPRGDRAPGASRRAPVGSIEWAGARQLPRRCRGGGGRARRRPRGPGRRRHARAAADPGDRERTCRAERRRAGRAVRDRLPEPGAPGSGRSGSDRRRGGHVPPRGGATDAPALVPRRAPAPREVGRQPRQGGERRAGRSVEPTPVVRRLDRERPAAQRRLAAPGSTSSWSTPATLRQKRAGSSCASST